MYLEKSGCIRAKRLCSGKVVVFVQGGFIRAKMFLIEQSVCIRVKWLYSGKKLLHSGKVVVFG